MEREKEEEKSKRFFEGSVLVEKEPIRSQSGTGCHCSLVEIEATCSKINRRTGSEINPLRDQSSEGFRILLFFVKLVSAITSKILRISTENLDSICSFKSRLVFSFMCFVGILSFFLKFA